MKKLKPWLVLFLVFLAGGMAGVVATRIVVRHFILRVVRNPEILRERIEHDLVRKLDLNADQRANVDKTLMHAHDQIRGLRGEFQPRFVAVVTNAQQEISATLTPEQQRKFDKYQEENMRFMPR